MPSSLHPPHSWVGAEAAALALEPCRVRQPPPTPRPAPQGSSCEKQTGRGIKAKERRRGIEEGGGESCTFLQAEPSVPSEGPQPRELPPEPWASHMAAAASPPLQPGSHGKGSPALWLSPSCSMPVSRVCDEALVRCPGTESGPPADFRWETAPAWGFGASCMTT